MDPGTLFRIRHKTALRIGKVDAAWMGRMGVLVVGMGGCDCELQLYAEG
jgi:hypothetical protein